MRLQQAEGGWGDWPARVLRRCSLSVYLRNLPKKSGPDSSRETWLVGVHVCHLNSRELLSASWHLLQGDCISSGEARQRVRAVTAPGMLHGSLPLWHEAACGGWWNSREEDSRSLLGSSEVVFFFPAFKPNK